MSRVLIVAAQRSARNSLIGGIRRIPAVRYAAVRNPGTNRPVIRIRIPWRWKYPLIWASRSRERNRRVRRKLRTRSPWKYPRA